MQRTLHPDKEVEHKYSVWVEGRWVYYVPTFSPTPEVQEWGGRWERHKQAWRLPRLTRIVRKIKEYDPEATWTHDASRLLTQDWEQRDAEVAISTVEDLTASYARLYPYQRIAVRALVTRPYHGELLTLSPGLGKTPTSIVAADLFVRDKGESQRVLVVAPLSLTRQWEREIETWSEDPRVEVIHQDAPTPDRTVRWTVTNYDSLLERVRNQVTGTWMVSGQLKEEFDLNWDVVILDESVLVKNRKAKRTSVIRTLAHRAKRVWLLSGAPITRDNSDLWSQLNIMEPDYFSSFWRYANEFCIVQRTQWSQGEIMGSRRGIKVREEFPELLFVRNQEEVFDDLPEYIYQDVMLEMHPKQKKAHDDVLQDWLHELEENRDKRVEVTAVIAMLTRLQQITSNLYNLQTTGEEWPDYSAKADYVEELLGDYGEVEWPVLVWVHHRPGAEALLQRLLKKTKRKDSSLYKRRVEKIVGGTKNADAIIEDFKAGKVDVLLLGISVGKYGHSLANAKTIIPFDKTWDSDAWFQMLHRAAGARGKLTGFHHHPLLINPRCVESIDTFVELNLAGKLPDMAAMTGADLSKILRSLGEEHVHG